MNKKARNLGHSLMEMIITVLVFNLFLVGAFLVFSYGLKNWKLIETKADVQSQAEVAMGRLLSDLVSTDITTLVTGNSPVKYVAFETSVNTSGEVEKDNDSLVWKGYILYYTSPSDNGKPLKKLLRKYIPHDDRMIPKKINLAQMSLYLTDTCNTGEQLKTVSRNIYDMDISVNANKYIVDVSFVTLKKFTETTLAYDKDFSKNVGQERVTLRASIMPRNTQN